MSERSIFSKLVRQPDGAFSAIHGAFLLQSALQPIFCEQADGTLQIAAFKGLIRATTGDTPCSPTDFFLTIPEEERLAVDSLCRSLHILNAGALGRRNLSIIVNFHTGLYDAPQAVRQEIEWLRLAAHEAGLSPDQVACELREQPGEDPAALQNFAERLHEAGFSVAIDEYTGEDRDLDRLQRLQPQFVTFETAWLRSFAENTAGLALLRVVVGQFAHKGIRAIVTGIEEPEMIGLCREMGGPLMQGYLLARPELAPTNFNHDFPEAETDPDSAQKEVPSAQRTIPVENRVVRPVRHFGKRGA